MCLQHYCCYVSTTSFCYVCYIFSSTVFHSLSSFSLCLSQFEDFVMDICFEILDNSKNALKNLAKDIERRCDPIYVSRMITTMVTVSSKQLTQKLRIWASFMFSLCNSYTYFHSISSYVTAKIPASQLKRLIFYPHLMCQNTSDIFYFFYIYSFQYYVWSPEISPWHVISTIQVNANGDRGVLACQWHEPYYDGIAPYRWTGSVPILRQWSKTGARAVKYGQCWVLAGVACTGETFTTLLIPPT